MKRSHEGGWAAVLAAILAVGGGGATAAEGESKAADRAQEEAPPARVRVTPADCRALLRAGHVPQGQDVPGAAHVPGRDVRGNPVAPADLPGSAGGFRLPDVMVVELGLDVLEWLGREDPLVGVDGRSSLGRVLVARDGRAVFDGRVLDRERRQALRRACRGALSESAPESATPAAEEKEQSGDQ